MLMRTDPFRDLDRLTESVFGSMARPTTLPMDAFRDNQAFVIEMEVPGVDPDSIDLTVEKNVLTVHAERRPRFDDDKVERIVAERSYGAFSRQLFLGESLDVDALTADYDAGVLTIRIPVAEQAKPRKIAIGSSSGRREISS
ncbi:Hsp20/alpha crystallin family protein [Nocardioides caldifontis]|uniref:Hsp20/alpha crystallin family protein n=1 Tax=Nocardioides caldifontis TaxID=2588938 RepID=UPI0011DFE70E|nr:Hsp20/alpha crystallin family protein [Nocardioides caldifontis]